MQVIDLWRYPVKSLLGERVDEVAITPEGLDGDRRLAIFDAETGLGLTGRRVPQLLFASARLCESGDLEITLPDGSIADDDQALSAWLDRRVTLRSATTETTRRYENPADFELAETTHDDIGSPAGHELHEPGQRSLGIQAAEDLGHHDPVCLHA